MKEFLKEKSIKYLNRDYNSLKRDLIRYSQAHHSGVFQDFNEASPGMAILDICAYVGDVLSFYQDMQFQELKQETARQIENVVSIAKQQGYRPAGKRAGRGIQTFFLEVPATTDATGNSIPDPLYCPTLLRGAKLYGPGGAVFETLEDVQFSTSAATPGTTRKLEVTGSRFDQSTGRPTYFALMKDVEIVAGETKTDIFDVADFVPFRTIELPMPDVLEVLSVNDSDGGEWNEVDYLVQEVVFESSTNENDDSSLVPYVMKLKTVPRRFVTDRDPLTKKTSLIFGSGDGVNFDDVLIPNLAEMALPLPGRNKLGSFAIDPQNFLKTRTLGLSPFNTTLTVSYRVGGGPETNVPSNSIQSIGNSQLLFSTTGLDPLKRSSVESSLETVNVGKTEGGGPEETISEIKANSSAFFAAQNRVVTKEDYIARIMSLPAKFGKPEKVYVKRDVANSMALDVHLLSRDSDGYLSQCSPTLVKNIKTYLSRYRILTDAVNLLQTDIINLKIDFGVVVSPKLNRTEVVAKCLSVVKDYVSTDRMQIGQPIVFSDLLSEIQSVYGVISVYKLDFKNIFGSEDGLSYSGVRFSTQANTSNGILYCPDNSIFEIKYPNRDIVGENK